MGTECRCQQPQLLPLSVISALPTCMGHLNSGGGSSQPSRDSARAWNPEHCPVAKSVGGATCLRPATQGAFQSPLHMPEPVSKG